MKLLGLLGRQLAIGTIAAVLVLQAKAATLTGLVATPEGQPVAGALVTLAVPVTTTS